MKTKLLLTLTALLALADAAFAQGTTFTYQGRLDTAGIQANGSYDLQFSLWNASSGPSQLGGTLTTTGTAVSNGLFTASHLRAEFATLQKAVARLANKSANSFAPNR